jgi:hypothetical protein
MVDLLRTTFPPERVSALLRGTPCSGRYANAASMASQTRQRYSHPEWSPTPCATRVHRWAYVSQSSATGDQRASLLTRVRRPVPGSCWANTGVFVIVRDDRNVGMAAATPAVGAVLWR